MSIEKVFGDNKAEHGIAEIFQSLVVILGGTVFVAERGVGERQFEQGLLPEAVADGLFECAVGGVHFIGHETIRMNAA
jgi:hypothetical protein